MILRRIADALREQNWFTVIIEIFIVVIGIFLGLQVTEWNENRKDRTLEQTYLVRLLADVDASIERNTFSRNFVANHVENSETVLKALMTCHLDSNQRDNFANGIFHMGKIVPVTFVLGTINEIHSTGSSSILHNIKIRNLLNELLDEAQFQNALFPLVHASKEQELAYVYQYVIFLTGSDQDVDGSITWQDINIDFQAMCGNSRAHAAISTIKTKGYENIDFLGRAISKLKAAKETLEQEVATKQRGGELSP